MNNESSATILDLAISKELAAVKFYHKLMQQATSFEQMEVIRSIELMERKHAETLQQLKNSPSFEQLNLPPLDAQQLTQLGEPENQLPSSFEALLLLAIKREDLAYQLYTQLAHSTQTAPARHLFEKLAQEELKHKKYFEQLKQTQISRE